MGFIIVGFLIGIIYGFYHDEMLAHGIAGAFFGMLIYIFAGGIIGLNLPKKEVVTEQELFALNNQVSIEGEKYLFSGYIKEELVYRYVVNTEKGKHIEELKTDCAYIKEGDYTPIIKTHKTDFEKHWYRWFAYELSDCNQYVEFCVPDGTIIREYNIDLK